MEVHYKFYLGSSKNVSTAIFYSTQGVLGASQMINTVPNRVYNPSVRLDTRSPNGASKGKDFYLAMQLSDMLFRAFAANAGLFLVLSDSVLFRTDHLQGPALCLQASSCCSFAAAFLLPLLLSSCYSI